MVRTGMTIAALLAAIGAVATAQEAMDAATSSVAIREDAEPGPTRAAETPETAAGSVSRQEPSSGLPRALGYGAILKKVKKEATGDIVNVALKQRQRGQWAYEFTVLDRQGRLTKLLVNAQTAAILSKTRR